MRFVVIGLGSFGSNVAKTLYEKGHEVVAVDARKERVDAIKMSVSHAIKMDTTDKESLSSLDLKSTDAVIVGLGPGMESSILTVLYLHEIDVKHVVTKAISEDHAKILEALGNTDIVYPEKDMAIRTALRLATPHVLDYFPLPFGISAQEIGAPAALVGKSLRQLDLSNRYGVQIIAIRQLVPEKMHLVPNADYVIKDSDILVIVGKEEQLARISGI